LAEIVVPGVWWLHETRGSNVFAVEAADGQLLLVDCGFASSADGIAAELAQLAPGRPPSQLLLTHAHVDHTGAAAALRERLGLRVVAGAGDCARDELGRAVLREPLGRSHRWRRFLQRLAGSHRAPEVLVDVALGAEAELAPGVLAVPAPGHTPGSYCYVDTVRGVAFVGDLVISHRHGLSRSMRVANADDAAYERALTAFAARAPALGCTGHGAPVLSGFAGQLAALAARPRGRMRTPLAFWRRAQRLARFARMLSTVRRRR
jgi:glyoxylase-like metal-dependent hydrolase (beta-lactamase superfamily II)